MNDNTTTLPIHYHSPTNPIGVAIIDRGEYEEVLKHFKWYLSDTRTPRPPKTTIRVLSHDGTTKPFVILLNRLVWLLHTSTDFEVAVLLGDNNKLRDTLLSLQRIRSIDGNPFNCSFSNLDGTLPPRSSLLPRLNAHRTPPLSALPQLMPSEEGLEREAEPNTDGIEPSILELLSRKVVDNSQPTTVRNTTLPHGE